MSYYAVFTWQNFYAERHAIEGKERSQLYIGGQYK